MFVFAGDESNEATSGLCGRKNGDATDDFFVDDVTAQVLASAQDFGNYFKYSDRYTHTSDYVADATHPCTLLANQNHDTFIRLQSFANDMRDVNSVFAHCFERVDAELFSRMLLEDTCYCVTHGGSESTCRAAAEPILQAYTFLCAQTGSVVQWRSASFFRKNSIQPQHNFVSISFLSY